jgi:diguanylate cyclase (GGDEF)-like protein/PAS domain S-box-containing protein
VFVIGFTLGLLAPPATNSPTASNPAQVLGILDGLIATTLWTFGFVLMVTQRLNVAERQTRKEFELIFYASPDAVILSRMEDGYLVEVNDGFATLSGFSREEALGNYSMEGLHFWKSQADRQRMLDELSLNGTCKDLEFEFRRKDGSGLTAVLSARLVMVRGQPHILSVVHDVTERKLLEIRLQKQASTDVLTGAANRRFFIESAGYELQQAQHLNQPLSVALIDLDHFKQVNDNFGHTEGDHVLVEFTRLCEQNIRDGDILARFGGDEFALLLPNSDVTQAVAVAERIQLALVTPVLTTGNVPLEVTISVGIAEVRSKPETLDEILARADQALYRVKASGRNRIEIYQEAVPNL